MADEFLTTEPAAAPEKKTRKRRPMSDETKEKLRASNKARREDAFAEALKAQSVPKESVEAPKPEMAAPSIVSPRTGLSEDEQAVIDLTRKLAEAQARIKDAGIPASQKLMIEKAVRADVFNVHRYHVELTPSMCEVKNCGYDAATDPDVGFAGWDAAPIHQILDNGKTFGQRLIELKEYHKTTQHTAQTINDHIITAEELHKRQWGVGQSIKGDFLQGAK